MIGPIKQKYVLFSNTVLYSYNQLCHTQNGRIEDIGGCRIVVESQRELDRLLARYRANESRHRVREDRSYVDNPRPTGYRCHHLVLDFVPESREEETFRDRRIEVQLRTKMQHSWATAVEALSLKLYQDLKAGDGDPDWLRFFQLISAEFSEFEGTAPVPNVPPHPERIMELRALDAKIDAVHQLQNLNQSFKFIPDPSPTALKARYFMVQFDARRNRMKVVGYDRIGLASDAYGDQERDHADLNTVVVEVDSIQALRELYPNYFLDVRLFSQNAARIMRGEPLSTTLSSIELERSAKSADMSWLIHFPGMFRPRGTPRKRAWPV